MIEGLGIDGSDEFMDLPEQQPEIALGWRGIGRGHAEESRKSRRTIAQSLLYWCVRGIDTAAAR
jgi:hypothetical protein